MKKPADVTIFRLDKRVVTEGQQGCQTAPLIALLFLFLIRLFMKMVTGIIGVVYMA